jgi:Uma2 family endonuclease
MPDDGAMSLSTEPLVTLEQLGRPPYCGRRCELVRGRIVDVSPAHGRHGSLAGAIHAALVLWAAPRAAGQVLSADTGYILRRNPDTVRAPDVGFVRAGRAIAQRAFVEGAPDVAIEVLSADVSTRELSGRIRDYLGAGAAQVWIVDAEERTLSSTPLASSRSAKKLGLWTSEPSAPDIQADEDGGLEPGTELLAHRRFVHVCRE